jgi:two-component sensor histidine kinase
MRKCGALAAAGGRIEVNWSHPGDGWLTLRWTERGGPPAEPPARQGVGHRFMERMIGQLKGKSNLDWRPEGLACEIAFRT